MKTRAEYLTKRGWSTTDADWRRINRIEAVEWIDPLIAVDAPPCPIDRAVTIQRARDAAEERAAWVRFAAAERAWGGVDDQGNPHGNSVDDSAVAADDTLARYRARFAAPDRFDDEVTPVTRLANDPIAIDLARWHRTGYLARPSAWARLVRWLRGRA